MYPGEGKGQCVREMEKTKPPGHSRPVARCKAWRQEKRRDRAREGGGGYALHGRATVKGTEKGVILGCEVMRLDLGFRKVRKATCLHKINTVRSHYMRERERE